MSFSRSAEGPPRHRADVRNSGSHVAEAVVLRHSDRQHVRRNDAHARVQPASEVCAHFYHRSAGALREALHPEVQRVLTLPEHSATRLQCLDAELASVQVYVTHRGLLRGGVDNLEPLAEPVLFPETV